MAGKTYLYQTAASLDLDKAGNRLDTDGVKLYCTTMAKNIADRAIQVHHFAQSFARGGLDRCSAATATWASMRLSASGATLSF
eukprot:scaffold229113_cov26-Tisochrysis_lutea.AAC.4